MTEMEEFERRCKSSIGDEFRVFAVGRFEEAEYDIRYMRDDVAEAYSEAKIAEIYQDVGVQGLGKALDSEALPLLGDLEMDVHLFESGITVVRWNENGREAIFLGLDRNAEAVADAIHCLEDAFES